MNLLSGFCFCPSPFIQYNEAAEKIFMEQVRVVLASGYTHARRLKQRSI